MDACLERLGGAARVAIATHERPDGDAVGCCIALRRMLAARGVDAAIVGLDQAPDRYGFLTEERFAGPGAAAAEGTAQQPDLAVVLDAGNLERVPEAVRTWHGRVPMLDIDHHPGNTQFGDVNLVDPGASSVGELLYRLAVRGGYPLDRETAIALWVAIVTDTGRFAYENTTPRALRIAAALVEYGVPTADIERKVYQSLPLSVLRLHARAIENLVVEQGGKLAYTILGEDDYRATGCKPEDTEGIVDIPRAIAGVEVAVFFYALEDRSGVKASLRSNGAVDVGALCRRYDGGGHRAAAGCTLPDASPDTLREFLASVTSSAAGSGP